jgi:hypothetical protein
MYRRDRLGDSVGDGGERDNLAAALRVLGGGGRVAPAARLAPQGAHTRLETTGRAVRGVLIGPASLGLVDLGNRAARRTGGDTGGHLGLLRPADLRGARDGAAVGGLTGAGMGGLLLAAVLLLKRPPAVLALRPMLRPLRSKGRDVLFLGWLGPVGTQHCTTPPSP